MSLSTAVFGALALAATGSPPVTVFRHGDLGYWCVRSPAVTNVGGRGRVFAVAELWNYTGNFCACFFSLIFATCSKPVSAVTLKCILLRDCQSVHGLAAACVFTTFEGGMHDRCRCAAPPLSERE
jgi:hypothetical protein